MRPVFRWRLFAAFLVGVSLLPSSAGALPRCFDDLVGLVSPRRYARLTLQRFDERVGSSELRRLEAVVQKLGGTEALSPYHPPEANLFRLRRAAWDALEARAETPAQRLRRYAEQNPIAAPLIERLLAEVERRGIKLRWTDSRSLRDGDDIELSTDAFTKEHPEFAMLATLAHELRHDGFLFPDRRPGETREAFLSRWREIFLQDELHAIRAGIRVALEAEQRGGPPAESVVTGASRVVLALQRRPYRSAARQEAAEREVLERWSNETYPKIWSDYLESRWNVLELEPR